MSIPTPFPLRPVACAQGFSMRKARLLREFTQRRDLKFLAPGSPVPGGADLLLWGAAPTPRSLSPDVRVVRVEDGFVRSVGLGADLTRPVSWVFDDEGMYFDASVPSRLERLLQECRVGEGDLRRARILRERIVREGVTKYNLASSAWAPGGAGRPVALVAGQVETDAAIAAGTVDVRTNIGLLQAVRQARPQAWVVYKPHPDVVAGLRSRGSGEAQALQWCDEVVTSGAIHEMIDHVDEVHVMTSLTGFEALLRGKPVWCYGQPFYSGYGLTTDRQAQPRRTRRLSIDELVACALLQYPTYLHPGRGTPCSAEEAVDALLEWRSRTGGHTPLWRRWLRPLLARP